MPPRPPFCVGALSSLYLSHFLSAPRARNLPSLAFLAPISTIGPHATLGPHFLSLPSPSEFLPCQPLSSLFLFFFFFPEHLLSWFLFIDLSNPHHQTAPLFFQPQAPRSRKAAPWSDESGRSLLVPQLLSGHLPSLRIRLSPSISTDALRDWYLLTLCQGQGRRGLKSQGLPFIKISWKETRKELTVFRPSKPL